MSRLSDASIEARVAVMSVADLRATIVAAGRSHEDVVEKGELRRRAMAALAATNDHRDAEDGGGEKLLQHGRSFSHDDDDDADAWAEADDDTTEADRTVEVEVVPYAPR